jgi:hypothetical protein
MIPIEILKIKDILRDGYHIFCRIHIKNKEYRSLIDTGCSMTMFNIKKYYKFSDNIIENNNQIITTINGDISSKYGIIDEIKIGNIIINNYKTILIDLESFNGIYRKRGLPLIDCVIGNDILMNYKSIINYFDKTLTLNE